MKMKFPFGVSCVPYAKSADMPVSEWESDFSNMKKLGFNTVRGFVSWDRIEYAPGKYDFSKLDLLFELTAKYGLDVVLNVGGAFSNLCGIYPPHWLVRSHRCQEVVRTDNGTSFGPRRFLCMDDPLYKDISSQFIETAVRRYRSKSNLIAWSVWNEPILAYACKCHHTLGLFRDYLKRKYHNDIQELNQCWGSEFPLHYEEWEEVEPGLEGGFGNGYVAALDWIEFNEWKIAENVRRESELVRSLDPGRATTLNIITDPDDNRFYRNDLRALAKSVSVTGYSHYLLQAKPYEAALSLDRIRCAAKTSGGFFNILETEAGPYRYYDDYYQATADGNIRAKNHWQSVAHGARMILLWKYRGRISDKQTDEFNLVAWDGSITERARINSSVSRDLQGIADLLSMRSIQAKTAIFTPQQSRKYVELDDGSLTVKDLLHDSIAGAYKMLWDANVATDILCEEDMRTEELSRYQLILIPFAPVVSEEAAEALTRYVENGGCVFADSGLAMQTTECHNQFRAPGYGLTKVFGAYFNDMLSRTASPEMKVSGRDYELPVSRGYAILHPLDASVCAAYSTGEAALTENHFGKGRAWLSGMHIFEQYYAGETAPATLFKEILAQSGADNDYPPLVEGVELCELFATDKSNVPRLFIAINHNNHRITTALRINGGNPAVYIDPRTGRHIEPDSLNLEAYETLVMLEQR